MAIEIGEDDWLVCCGSVDFAKLMVKASPFNSLEAAIESARDIWFNEVNVGAWLEAFAAHPQIGKFPSPSTSADFARRSVAEQSAAFAATSESALEGKVWVYIHYLRHWQDSREMLAELKGRYANWPIVELEIAAKERMKIIELRIAKLFSEKANVLSQNDSTKPQGTTSYLVKPGTYNKLQHWKVLPRRLLSLCFHCI